MSDPRSSLCAVRSARAGRNLRLRRSGQPTAPAQQVERHVRRTRAAVDRALTERRADMPAPVKARRRKPNGRLGRVIYVAPGSA